MAKSIIHARSSARKFGGVAEDYLAIHDLMDSSKSVLSDNRHRALTHNSWFINQILEKVFGNCIINSDGKEVPVKTIGEQHVLEDFNHNFIPTAQDYLQEIKYKPWMSGKGSPYSSENMKEDEEVVYLKTILD